MYGDIFHVMGVVINIYIYIYIYMENCDFILIYVRETGVLNYNICVIHVPVLENEFLCCHTV